ncbi:protein Abitram-like isoform X4 [Salvia hispanica]|uniref:protein Abitram-like isoform X4 n=1 Tax=Salvia hispanica TaxID=49212 RepID=UPI002009B6E9|nr:protein Abitram-like isoform X4 [Salvia hispanica]
MGGLFRSILMLGNWTLAELKSLESAKSLMLSSSMCSDSLFWILIQEHYQSVSKNAQHFESNTALYKVLTAEGSYIVRCCVKGPLLEVNDRLIKQPELLNTMIEGEGYVAIMMPRPADWLKAKASLLDFESYKKLRTKQ